MRKKNFTAPILSWSLPITEVVYAVLKNEFEYPNGKTHWQHVANWSGGSLIILLGITAIFLYLSHRRTRKANLALEDIRSVLEQRVIERTRTLDESNRLLQSANVLLEGEISHHKSTTALLHSSESYIKNILESMPLMLVGLNQEMKVTQWNKQAEIISGKNAKEALDKKLWEAYPTITVSPDQITKVMNEQKPITIKHSQRGQSYYDISIYPLTEQLETGIVILIDNVTQRILAENMLVQRDKMSSMGELASTMAHDIDVPLQAIFKDLQQIQLSLNPKNDSVTPMSNEEISGILHDAELRGRQVSGIISNLLEFAHSQGNTKRSSSIIDIIEHALKLSENILTEPSGLRFRDIIIDKHFPTNLPTVPCNIAELHQVFFSLFRHAFKYLNLALGRENYSPTIRIDITEAYDALWIKIHHNGIGLTQEEQQYIFEPFFNKTTDDANVDVVKRLSFTYFIISEHHNGELAVTSDILSGTTFHIQLQLK